MKFPCSENGANCDSGDSGMKYSAQFYNDPSNDMEAVQRRLQGDN